MNNKPEIISAIIWGVLLLWVPASFSAQPPRLPVGINLDSPSFFAEGFFVDLCKSMDFWAPSLPASALDSDGYPLEIPCAQAASVSAPISERNPPGTYLVLYDGEGTIERGYGCLEFIDIKPGRITVEYKPKAPGQCSDGTSIRITRSVRGNHLRNLRIVPVEMENTYLSQPFVQAFLDAVKPFHCLRFMDWLATNSSSDVTWAQRRKPSHYTQVGTTTNNPDPFLRGGVALEHVIQLSNITGIDPWVCVPHKADDEYIGNMARLFRDNLDPSLKVYLEYSNEVWNEGPGFSQSKWMLYERTGMPDSIKQILSQSTRDFEWAAYMFSRVFNIWHHEWAQQKHRVIRVGAIQHGWPPNTRVFLEYLRTRGGCDAISPAGYFGISSAERDKLKAMPANTFTGSAMIDAIRRGLPENEWKWTSETAAIVNEFRSNYPDVFPNLQYITYEGGQHVNPHGEGQDEAFWESQILPGMYDLYMDNFARYTAPEVNSSLFVAFSLVGHRKSVWGSWGHLETLDQIYRTDLREVAPKYQALLDANVPRDVNLSTARTTRQATAGAGHGRPLRTVLFAGHSTGGTAWYSPSGRLLPAGSTNRMRLVIVTDAP